MLNNSLNTRASWKATTVGLHACKSVKLPKVIKPKSSSFQVQEISLSWSGISKKRVRATTTRNSAYQRRSWKDTVTLLAIWPSHKTADIAWLVHGTVPSDFGTSERDKPLRDSLVTQETYLLLLSPQITDKLPVVVLTETSRSGTLLESANSPLSKMLTLTGSHVLDSTKTLRPQSLSQLHLTRPSRCGTTKQWPSSTPSLATNLKLTH